MQAAATVARCLPAAQAATSGLSRRPASRHVMVVLPMQRCRPARALGGNSEEQAAKGGGIKREEEPEEYWKSQAERDGKNPFQDPLAQMGILAILFPFIFLAVAIVFGWVDLTAGR